MLGPFRWLKQAGDRRKVHLEPEPTPKRGSDEIKSDHVPPAQNHSNCTMGNSCCTAMDNSKCYVATFKKKTRKQIDMRSLSLSGLASLKRDDPFMYYSIPAVRSAALCGTSVNELVEDMPINDNELYTVARQSRISFECCGIPSKGDISSTVSTVDELTDLDLDIEQDDIGEDWILSFYRGR